MAQRADIEELLVYLHAIVHIQADVHALNPEAPQFTVAITMDRGKLKARGVTELPQPTRLFEGILTQLQAWLQQRIREEAWALNERNYGASIDSVMSFLTVKMKECAAGTNIKDSVEGKLYANAVLRLKELKERREAGDVEDPWSAARDRARNQWAKDEFEAPKREEEQRRQREQRSFHADFDDITNEWFTNHYEAFGFGKSFYERARGGQQRTRTTGGLDHYAVLEIEPTATKGEVEKARRRKLMRHHPDRAENEKDRLAREARTSAINVAFKAICKSRGW